MIKYLRPSDDEKLTGSDIVQSIGDAVKVSKELCIKNT